MLSSAVRECMVVAYLVRRPEVSQDRQRGVCIDKIRPYGKKNEKLTIKPKEAEEGRPSHEALKDWMVEGREGINGGKSCSINLGAREV
jgi:hypothetical protein